MKASVRGSWIKPKKIIREEEDNVMSRGSDKNAINVIGIFPDNYKGFSENLKLEGKKVISKQNWVTNVYSEVDLKYELLAWIKKEDRESISKMRKTGNKHEWKNYFEVSPFLKLFGLKNEIAQIENLDSVLQNTMACAVLVTCLDIDYVEDEDILTILYKILKITDGETEERNIRVTSMEKKQFSEEILGFNVWEEEHDPFDVAEWHVKKDDTDKVNYVNEGIKKLYDKFCEEENKIESEECEKAQFDRRKGDVIRFPQYMKPIVNVVNLWCLKYPWAYYKDKRSIYDEIELRYSTDMKMRKEVYESLKKILTIQEYKNILNESLNSKHFIERYYEFIGAILHYTEDNDDKYIVFFTIEKIFAIDLFEEEARLIESRTSRSRKLSEAEEDELILILESIYQLNGAWEKKKIAKEVINAFFDKLDNEKTDVSADILINGHLKKEGLMIGENVYYTQTDLQVYIKSDTTKGNSVCKWYEDRHRDLKIRTPYKPRVENNNSNSNSNKKSQEPKLQPRILKEWCKEWIPEENIKTLKWVIRNSIYSALKFDLSIRKDENNLWGERYIDWFGEDEEEEEDDDVNLLAMN